MSAQALHDALNELKATSDWTGNFRLAMQHVDAMMQHGHITDISQMPTTAEMMTWMRTEHNGQPFTWLPPPPPRPSSQPPEHTNARLEDHAHVFSAQDDLTRPGLVTGDSTFRARHKYDPVYCEQSLAKGPQIGYRSAMLHGTTEERWERGMTGWT
ncbi:hypothetical protein JCM10450v2_002994 [Rhodotorula kratochvilovae]